MNPEVQALQARVHALEAQVIALIASIPSRIESARVEYERGMPERISAFMRDDKKLGRGSEVDDPVTALAVQGSAIATLQSS